jgi:hypothetical protein
MGASGYKSARTEATAVTCSPCRAERRRCDGDHQADELFCFHT